MKFLNYNLDLRWIILIILLIVNGLGLNCDVFWGDSSTYASISKIMADSNNWFALNSVSEGPFLDKPHLSFWIWALSIKIFGATTLAYKVPAYLFFCLTLVYIYKLASKLYNRDIALHCILIFSSMLHIIVSNNDVRMENFLSFFIIGAIYHLTFINDEFDWKHLILASLFTGLTIMTKGLVGALPIVFAIIGQMAYRKGLKQILQPKWILFILLSFIFILPELYCLYLQFDQSSALVFGQTHVNYLKLFFWDLQFGRFLMTGPIKGEVKSFYFLHTTLWTILPWTPFLIYFLKRKWSQYSEFYCFGAFWGTMIVFCLSKFQLSYYTNIIFPYLAILLAWFLADKSKLIVKLTCLGIAIGLFLNLYFYPLLTQYQGSVKAAKYINHNFPKRKVASLWIHPTQFFYYLNRPLHLFNPEDCLKKENSGTLILLKEEQINLLNSNRYTIHKVYDQYPITRLGFNFLNPNMHEKFLLIELK